MSGHAARRALRACLKTRFGVPPLGGAAQKPPKGGTPNLLQPVSRVFFKQALSGLCRKFTGVFLRPARDGPALVAQIFNLLYRRFIIGKAPNICSCVGPTYAQQNAILRYSRLKICATRLPPMRGCIYETEHLVTLVLCPGAGSGTDYCGFSGWSISARL
jgi:hypothetical protein